MNHSAEPPTELVSLDRVRVEFGSLVAVRDVCLGLRGGELLGLIGPNGAGKTTLLRAIGGLQPLTSGKIRLMGNPPTSADLDVRYHLGFTPDTPPVYDELTTRQFLRFVARAYGIKGAEIDARIDFWLEKTWLKEKADQKIKALSRGMRQRIGIARTLLPNPSIILLDEPAAGLDPAGRVQFRRLLCSLREQGKAIIVSSHILADLNEYCTHIAIMAQGVMVRFGTVAEVAGSADGRRCRYTMVLARPIVGLGETLSRIPGVKGVQVHDDRVILEYGSRNDEAAELLARLVGLGLPVASFVAHTPDLEEAYMRTGIRQVD